MYEDFEELHKEKKHIWVLVSSSIRKMRNTPQLKYEAWLKMTKKDYGYLKYISFMHVYAYFLTVAKEKHFGKLFEIHKNNNNF